MGNAPSAAAKRTPTRKKTTTRDSRTPRSPPAPAWRWEFKDGRYQPVVQRRTSSASRKRPLFKGWKEDNFDWYIMGNK